MSLTFTSPDGWVVSHLEYINAVYESVSCGPKLCTLSFNDLLFNINSQYLRQNQNVQADEAESSASQARKRKRSKSYPQAESSQVNYIKQALARIIASAKENGLFLDRTICDNNQAARMASRKFYLDTFQHPAQNLHGCNDTDTAIITDVHGKTYVFPRKCSFYCYDVRSMTEKMELKNQFDFILLDPPWWNKSIRRKKGKHLEASYKMMYNEELIKIPIGKLLSTKGLVAVWCTNAPSHLRSISDDMFPSWGVTYRAKWYWVKVTMRGNTVCDFYPIPGKQPYELLVLGSASANSLLNIPDGKLLVSIPSAVHSHKPPITELIGPYLPSEPNCLEIFARYLLPGWTSWGLEALKFQHLPLYTVSERIDEGIEDKRSVDVQN
ncbi:methyltransferase-like protein 4 [Orussus abietinus]|uniref:methyltransferase-like protein 4 n=1 Tax=Orussus abietinus TaxID=222816 RepID=UPI0006268FA8|nr:methyltransferase-like protein 4 [Orussus abietinus]